MPCGELVVLEVEAVTEVVPALGVALAAAGWDGFGVLEGVVRGGAVGACAVFAAAGSLAASVLGLAVGVCSAARGGASRSSSRAAGKVAPVGLIKPAGFALSERRLILGFSVEGFSKLNSAGASSGSGWVAGI